MVELGGLRNKRESGGGGGFDWLCESEGRRTYRMNICIVYFARFLMSCHSQSSSLGTDSDEQQNPESSGKIPLCIVCRLYIQVNITFIYFLVEAQKKKFNKIATCLKKILEILEVRVIP